MPIFKNKSIIHYSLFIIHLLFILFLPSCDAVNGAGETGNEFYTKIQNNEFEDVLELLTEDAITQTSQKEWIEVLKSINKERGNIQLFSRTAFSSEVKNEKIITTLTYNITYENGIFIEKIIFYKIGEEYKIQQYLYKM